MDEQFAAEGFVDDVIEPYLFFKTQVAAETPAWQLYLSGENNATRNLQLYVSNDSLATQQEKQQTFFRSQLLVPKYLTSGRYFIGVKTEGAERINLKSRIQPFVSTAFDSTTSITTNADHEFPYLTYKVNVPDSQIGWQVTLDAEQQRSSLYVRKGNVPNRTNNDGLSEQDAAIKESITHAPPMLETGDWYITVYSPADNSATLKSQSPDVKDINFVNINPGISNDTQYHQQTGWRYFRVSDIDQQLGALGWTLLLEQAPVGSRLAIRRNAVPTYWEYRENGSTGINQRSLKHQDSRSGVLQVAEHSADVWYIGVYSERALGSFVLNTESNAPANLDFNNGSIAETDKDNRYWHFYQLEVPETFEALQLDLLNDGEEPLDMVIRKGELPAAVGTSVAYCPKRTAVYNCSSIEQGQNVNSTSIQQPFGIIQGVSTNKRLLLAKQAPLIAGTYYIGIKSARYTPQKPLNYTLKAAGVGDQCGDESCRIGVASVDFGDQINLAQAQAGNISYLKTTVPDSLQGWFISSTYNSGLGNLAIGAGQIPNSYASDSRDALSSPSGWAIPLAGNDYYYVLNDYNNEIASGDIWIALGAQQDNTQATITAAPINYIGNLDDVVSQSRTITHSEQSLDNHQINYYRFSVDGSQPAITATVDTSSGRNVELALLTDTGNVLGNPQSRVDNLQGGGTGTAHGNNQLTLPDATGNYTLAVSSSSSIESYTLTINAESLPSADVLAFNNGSTNITEQPANSWRYFQVTVPTDAEGWFVDLDQNSDKNVDFVVRKGQLPETLYANNTSACDGEPLSECNTWQDGEQLPAQKTISGRYKSFDRRANYSSTFMASKNAPLTSGVYYIGVKTGASAGTYRLRSRGVGSQCSGSPCTVPLTTLSFPGSATTEISNPGDVSVYKFVIPENSHSVEMHLENIVGESMMVASSKGLPLQAANEQLASNLGFAQDTFSDEFIYHLHSVTKNPNTGIYEPYLAAGDYYITVIAQGQSAPDSTSLGTGNTQFRLNVGTLQPTLLSNDPLSVNETLTIENLALKPGQLKLFRWQASSELPNIEIDTFDTTGEPRISLHNTDTEAVELPYSPINSYIGNTSTGGLSGTGRQNFPYTETDVGNYYNMLVSSGSYKLLMTSLTVHSRGDEELDFNRGQLTVEQQAKNSWRYFKVEVPADAEGWEVVVKPNDNIDLNTIIRRGSLPDTLPGSGAFTTILETDTWEQNQQYVIPNTGLAGFQYKKSVTGQRVRDYDKHAVIGMNQPLQPGTYYIGVHSDEADNFGYDILSRGIGSTCGQDACQLSVSAVEFGSSASGSINTPRDSAFYKLTVPEDAGAWHVSLKTLIGEASMAIKYQALPNSEADSGDTLSHAGRALRTKETEYFYQFPDDSDNTALRPGTYYVAVTSQGQVDNSLENTYGSGRVDYQLTFANIDVEDLRDQPIASDSPYNSGKTDVEYGQLKAYKFAVEEAVRSVEVRLNETSGSLKTFTLDKPQVDGLWPYSYLGNLATSQSPEGGIRESVKSGETVINIDETNNEVLVLIFGNYTDYGNVPHISQFNLAVSATPITELAFNNGNSNAQRLQDKQQHLYKVTVPETFNGTAVNGWQIELDNALGDVNLAINKGRLPDPNNTAQLIQSNKQQTQIVTPLLTPGDWYIAATSSGISEYSLVSKPVIPKATIALAEKGSDSNFQSGEVSLDQQHTDYYRIDVPDNNAGLIRMQLTKISGEATTYLRYGGPSTLFHDEDSSNSVLYDRLNDEPGSQYSNWVVADGKNGYHNGQLQLKPGQWWLAVNAENASLQYQLSVTSGNVTPLNFQADTLTNQTLAADDIQYYQVNVPTTAGSTVPSDWRINLQERRGDVIAVFRERVPPGETVSKPSTFYGRTSAVPNWYHDNSDNNQLATDLEQGELTINKEQLKPGTSFYIGVYAKQDSEFDISVNAGSDPLEVAESLSIISSSTSLSVPANSRSIVEVTVPEDTEWYRQEISASAAISMTLQRGKVGSGNNPDESRYGTTLSIDELMLDRDQQPSYYPWHPTANFYLTLENSSNEPVAVTIENNGNRWEPDTQAPVFEELQLITREATGPLTDYTPARPAASDDYDGRVYATTEDTGPWALGQYTIVWTAIDSSGNQSTAEQQLAVVDTRAPTFNKPASITAEATGKLTSVELPTVTATDLVDGELTVTADKSGPFAVGEHQVTWSVSDSSGNQYSRTQAVTITDTTAPELSLPTTMTIATNDPQGLSPKTSGELLAWLSSASATDLVDETIVVSHNVSGYLPVGANKVTFTATDTAGNTVSDEATITITLDSAPPQLTVPDALIIEVEDSNGLPQSDARIQAFLNAASASDTQDGMLTVTNNLPAVVPYGLTIVTFSAEDSVGNSVSAQVELRLQLPKREKKSGLLMLLLSTMANEEQQQEQKQQ